MNDLGRLLLEAVGLLVAIQGLLWIYNYRFDAGKQKIKLENQQPLVGLKKVGFKADSDAHSIWEPATENAKYLGRIDGYPVEVSIKCQPASYWGENRCFKVRVFFAAELTGAGSVGQDIQNKGQSNFFKWNDGVILTATYAERKLEVGR